MLISIRRSGFLKNFSILLTGTAVAQAIPVLLQPLLRRLFTEDIFAVLAVYNSITSMLIVITTLRYEMAIVLPEKDRNAGALVILALLINFAVSTLFFLFIGLLPDTTSRWINWPEGHRLWLYFVPISVFLFSSSQTLNYWLIRKKAFKASAKNRVSRRLAEGACQSVGGLMAWQGSLIGGDIAGRAVNLFVALKQSLKHQFSFSYFNLQSIKDVSYRYKDFPLFQTIPALLNTASLMLPVLFVNSFYTTNSTAQFDLCRQVLLLPLALITTAMSQVLLQKFTEQRHKKQPLIPGFLKLTIATSIFAVVTILFFRIAGEPVFAFLFGEQWRLAGSWAAILAPAFMIQFVVSPLSTMIIALEKIRIGALWQLLYFLAILSLLFFDHLPENSFFVVFTFINISFYTLYWLIILFIIMNYERKRKRVK